MLLRDVGGGDLEVVYTRRRDELRSHPGQISFPGGRADPGETVEQAAVREAFEEVALDTSTVTVLGRLPVLYIPPSRFWLQAVVARWDAPHPLVPAEAEVADIIPVRVSALRDRDRWRAVRLSVGGWSWAWQLGEGRLLWGATAMVTAVLLGVLDPDWAAGLEPGDLPEDRHVRPWERRGGPAGGHVPVPGPARLRGVEERGVEGPGSPSPRGTLTATRVQTAGAAVAWAISALTADDAEASVLVLAGPGGTGAVGTAAAQRLAGLGRAVHVVVADSTPASPGAGAAVAVRVFDGTLPEAAVVVDALAGRGLHGPLRGAALQMARALRTQLPLVVAVDLPSGLDPDDGLVGEMLTADLTIAVGAPAAGLFRPGLGPFVGDLYVAPLDGVGPPLYRVVPGGDRGRWRE